MRQRLVHCLFREPTWQPETVRLDLLRPGRGWGRNIGSRKKTESAVSEQDTRTGLMPRTEFGPRVRLAFATNSRSHGNGTLPASLPGSYVRGFEVQWMQQIGL